MLPQTAPADYEKIKEIFTMATELSLAQRRAFLDESCAGDEWLRREVESLLKARDEAGEFLQDVSAVAAVHDSINRHENPPGGFIGKYRLVRELGRGGMGVVFLAEREDFRQEVALKLIKRGMDSEAILERFKREREILAALNHPNIARLLDGGTTDGGLPFFVMEYIEGVAVDEYCRANNLTETERLGLFRKICAAISFAHQKLIVHRDLKPSNILVNKEGEPKLLDFGIAKLLNSTDSDATQTHLRVLTPAFASPEQKRGEIVGTTSDVYSLGLILAEILEVQSSKLQVQSRSEIQSSKLNILSPEEEITDSTERPIQNPTSKIQNLNGDLKNILEMSLREDSSRRYASVEQFSEDIRRYLAGLPVRARKDSFSYRTRKFFERNRISVSIAGLLVLSLIVGIIATLWQARQAQRERRLAERRFENLRKLSDSFVTELHAAIQNLPGSLPARQLLLKRATEQLDALAEESGDNPALQDELAQAYYNFSTLPDMPLGEKEQTLNKTLAIYRNLLANDPDNIRYLERLALVEIEIADVAKVRGSVGEAVKLGESAISRLEQLVKSEPAASEHRLNLRAAYANAASNYILEGKFEKALTFSRRALEATEDLRKMNTEGGVDINLLVCRIHSQIGTELTYTGDYKTAIVELRQALEAAESERARNPHDTLNRYYLWLINRRLADALELNGETEKSLAHLQTALEIIESLLAESPKDMGYHRNSALTHILTGGQLERQNQTAKALGHFRRALELSEYVISTDSEYTESKADLARAEAALGNALTSSGKIQAGSTHLRRSLQIYEAIYDADNALLKRDYAETCAWLGAALLKEKNQSDEARSFLEKSFSLWSELAQNGVLSRADFEQPERVKKRIEQFNSYAQSR